MPSTFVHGFLPASCLIASRPFFPALNRRQWVKFCFIAFILGNAPDFDLIPAALFPEYWKLIHRNWGHNLFTVTLWVLFGQIAIRKFVSPTISKTSAWLVAGALVVSHLIFDSMMGRALPRQPIGVPLFWPINDTVYQIPFKLFARVSLERGKNPLLAHITSVDFWTNIFFMEIKGSAIFFTVWCSLLLVIKTVAMAFYKIRWWLFQDKTRARVSEVNKPGQAKISG